MLASRLTPLQQPDDVLNHEQLNTPPSAYKDFIV
jgi:hypothetical protein